MRAARRTFGDLAFADEELDHSQDFLTTAFIEVTGNQEGVVSEINV
jgi:hypothetical protein